MPGLNEISRIVLEAAANAGFELAGIIRAEDPEELEHFQHWIAKGNAGEMKYLYARDQEGRLKRSSIRNTIPWARSVIVCAINYNAPQPYSTQLPDAKQGWISRYAWGREDYHESVMRRLRRVEAAVKGGCSPDVLTRCYVDTGPIVERVIAKYAGIGWIGKNTCIINQKIGSWLFLGVILTSIELPSGIPPMPAPDRCGSCTRCIDACPTHALIAPYELDSNKCISYLTIEKRGAIADDLRSGMGRHLFGCDICQDVCPWNRKAPPTYASEFNARPELVSPALEWIAEISEEEFREVFRGSPVKRARRSGLRRNAVIAMGNSGDRKFLSPLKKISEENDEVLREAANWAIKRLNDSDAKRGE